MEKLKGAIEEASTRKDRKRLKKKVQRLFEGAERRKKGETHHRGKSGN